MNRHDSYQQPEATADNAKQWQVDLSERDAGKVGNDSDAGGVNGGKNANDINHISDQGETVEVRVIKDDRDEPNNDEPGQVEQGGQAGQAVQTDADESQYSTNVGPEERSGRAVQTDAEAQPRKRRIIELLGSSPLGAMAQTALDSVRQLRAKKQEYKQVGLIELTLGAPSSAINHSKQEALEQQRKHDQLNQLVEDGELDLSNKRVLQTYMDNMRRRTVISDETAESDSKFISKMLREGKIDLSDPEIAKEFLDTREYYDNRYLGIQEALELGKLDLSNEDIKRHFLDLLADVKADSVALLDASGLPIEEIAANERIRQVIVDETSRRVHSIDTRNYSFDGLSSADKAGDSYRFGVIDAICATEEGKQYLANSINRTSGCESIQDVGEEIENNILQGINSEGKWPYSKQYDELTHNSALIRNVAKYNGVLRKLGWEPLKKDESLAKLFYTGMDYRPNAEERAKKSIDLQSKAYKLGLVTPEATDRLYNHQFKELFGEAKKGSRLSLNNTGDYALLSGYVVSPDLAPSDNNLMANYWRKQSGYLGNSAMRLCMVKALDMAEEEQDDGQRLDLSDLIDENGLLKDAFFQNRPKSFLQDIYNVRGVYDLYGDERCAEIVRFLELHKDQASETDGGKAMIDLLSKMKSEDDKCDTEAVKWLGKSMGQLCADYPNELLKDGEPTDKFYGVAFRQYYRDKSADKFMPYIDDDWKDYYGDTGRKYLELVSTYPSCYSYNSYDKNCQKWIEDYLASGGPTDELLDGIMLGDNGGFSGKMAKVFWGNSRLCSQLPVGKQSYVELCEWRQLREPTRNDPFYQGHMWRELMVNGIDNYFDASGPTGKMLDHVLFNDIGFLYDHPESQTRLSDDKKSLVKFCGEYSLDNRYTKRYGLTPDNLVEYFDIDGPTSKMIDKVLFNDVGFLYGHPELQMNLTEDRKSLVWFCKEYSLDNSYMNKYGLTSDNLTDYFDANGPTDKLIDKVLFNDIKLIYDHPELQADLSDDKKSLVKFCGEYGLDNSYMNKYGLTSDNLTDYFDADGPGPKLWWDTYNNGGNDLVLIYRYHQNQDEAGRKRMGLDDKQIAVAGGYSSISEGNDWNNSRKLFESYVKEHYDELTADQIKWTASIMARLASSNASELAERSEAFTRELLKLDAAKIPEALDRIEDIYIHNHLPYVGKNYLVFRTMHPSPNLEDDFNFNNGRISPVLQQATGDLKSGKLDQMLNSRDAIIVSDLLRASLGSNNRSIREYLATLKNGQSLLDQLSSGELDWSAFNQPTSLMDKDTKANYDTLSTFAWHLATIYNSTLPGKEHPYQLMHQQSGTDEPSAQPNVLQADFTNLTSLIKPNSRYTLADRAVRYFAHFVGIEDLAGAERYMDNVVKEADARNRRMAEHLVTTKESKLQPGDLVKGMGGTVGDGIRYLSYAFQNGSISKEYLGDASRSDTTPLDADASIVPDQLNGQTINQIMNGWDRYMLANSYGGGLWVVLRPDNDRFIVTRRGKDEADQSVYDLSVPDANFDRTDLTQEEIDRRLKEIAEAKRHRREGLPKLEIFATGVDGDGHYGVRTGFGMNLVSFCVTDSTLRDSTPVSEVTKLEIALDGFYIPIVDRDSEKLIFTPADYDKMRQQMSGLSYYRTGDYQFAPEAELELPSANIRETTIPDTTTIVSELPASMAETDRKHEVINQTIKQAITGIPELNLSYKDYLDGDLTENIVEMIDTGSTGRQTNAPGSGDFDYMARLDRSILNDPTKKQQITDALLAAFGKADEVNGTSNQIDNLDHNEDGEGEGEASQADNKSRIVNGNLRLKQVSIDGLAEPVDIDITFAQKTNKVQYPTDAALADRLSNIKNQSETKYRQVLANIIYAKQFLKAAGAYKPRRSPEAKGIGGLGGVGIENWVLQHGGSFKQAARDFLTVADNCSSFEDFCAHYPVWDYGENHKGIRSKPHDNFVADNMNPEGYELMKEALRAVV